MATPFVPLAMTWRRQMRLAVVAALRQAGLQLNGQSVSIDSPGDWSFSDTVLPAIAVRTGQENKQIAGAMGYPGFNTTVQVQVKAVVQATTAEAAQDQIEALWYAVEQVILTNHAIRGAAQRIVQADAALEVIADGQQHLAGIAGTFHLECFESWTPFSDAPDPAATAAWPPANPVPVQIGEVGIHVDLVNVADPTATYQNPPFPQAVTPAPRTVGPDGRDEGYLQINLE